jgi:hypothetical protein
MEPDQVRFVEYDTSVEDATSVSTISSHCVALVADLLRFWYNTVAQTWSYFEIARTRTTRPEPSITAT